MGEWSELPGDILDAIGKRLIYSDYIRFCGVCVQWKSLLPKRPRLPVCEIPWLILPFNEESETHCSLYSVLEKKVYPLELPQARGKLYRGASNGWLAMVEDGPELKLLNPFTCFQIDLPPISTFLNVKEYVADRRGEEYAVLDRKMELLITLIEITFRTTSYGRLSCLLVICRAIVITIIQPWLFMESSVDWLSANMVISNGQLPL